MSYRDIFETDEGLIEFKEFIKQKGGVANYRLYSELSGKTTHNACSLSLEYFEPELRKRLTRTVIMNLKNYFLKSLF